MNQERIHAGPKRVPTDPRILAEDLDFCARCSNEISQKWNYCPNCGAAILLQKNGEK